LGLFLFFITNINAAHDDHRTTQYDDGRGPKLIDFEKHRKNFAFLARIMIFQAAANRYDKSSVSDAFRHWFYHSRMFNDTER
jgi:hypothetical protein